MSSISPIHQGQLPKKNQLITFDEQEQLQQQFFPDDEPQVKRQLVHSLSMLSEGQKSKIEKQQRKQKIQQYLDYRKSIGLGGQNKVIHYVDEDDLGGALIDQLGYIENVQKFNSQIELFIIAFNKNPENAIAQYIKKGVISDDQPQSIAQYLIKVEGIDKELLGQYFGKNNPKTLQILHSFCKLLKFTNVEFDKAIRILLARFRLPGQSQQIQRIIWQFSLAYFEDNTHVHKNADELFPLAYAIIMLATDAHNPKQQRKMSRQQFIKNTQCACPSISSEYLSGIYDRITKQKFETQVNYIQTLYARLKGISSNDFSAILKLTKQLMKGDVFLKVCYGSKKFVQRKIYLSQDQQKIQWINDPPKSDNQQPRFINIRDITDLTIGLGSQAMKKNNVPQEFDSLCFTITTYHRTLDLKAKTNKERSKWINYIRAILIRRREARREQLEDQIKTNLSHQQIQQIWNTQIFPRWDDHWDYKKKKPKEKNVIVRKFQAIFGCFKDSSKQDRQNQFENSGHQARGLTIKSSVLQTLWGLGLPPNSRKVLWPLVIGNNLALTSNIIQEIKKRVRKDPQIRKFTTFNPQIIELAQICRQFRPDIPPVRDLLLISQIFWRVFPKTQSVNPLNPLLNQLHADHFLAFYRADKNEVDSRIKLFEYLLEINAPKVKDHFKGLKLETRMFLVSWFLSVFYDCFSENQEFQLRIWDNFLLEGEIYLFKVGITIIKYYQVQLKMCTFHQGLKLLRFPKQTSSALFFKILQDQIDVKQQFYNEYVQKRKNAVIKTKVQAIPLQ